DPWARPLVIPIAFPVRRLGRRTFGPAATRGRSLNGSQRLHADVAEHHLAPGVVPLEGERAAADLPGAEALGLPVVRLRPVGGGLAVDLQLDVLALDDD